MQGSGGAKAIPKKQGLSNCGRYKPKKGGEKRRLDEISTVLEEIQRERNKQEGGLDKDHI